MKSIMEEFVERVEQGQRFKVDFEKRNLKVGKTWLIVDGTWDEERELGIENNYLTDCLEAIESLYTTYKYSVPTERSSAKRRVYFKALPVEELSDADLACNLPRDAAQARLEAFVLGSIINGSLYWNEDVMKGNWYWQSASEPELIILKQWVKGV